MADYALALEVTHRAAEVVHVGEALYFRADDLRIPVGGLFCDDALVEARRVLEGYVRCENDPATMVDGAIADAPRIHWLV